MIHWRIYFGLLFILTSVQESTAQDSIRQRTVVVKDSTKYSKRFLRELREHGYGAKFELIDDILITDDKYRSDFAQMLPKRREVFLKGQKNGDRYELKLNRVNYTTISYDFTFVDRNGKILRESGQADKTVSFTLGGESDQDENGNGYFCSEYFPVDKKCLHSVRIGLIEKKLVAKVVGCNNNWSVENCPTLR